MLSKETAQHIINLNPYDSIDKEIANRQFEVIRKGFNFLKQPENDFLYIADEVGLGKTYVALGIASLLRHFCSEERRSQYKDVVLVPKRNLQYKWVKETNNFITHNYLLECNIVKSVLGKTVGDCSDNNIHHCLELFSTENPSYEFFRNSSFSIATSIYTDWEKDLELRIPEGELRDCFINAREIFKKEEDKIYLKRLFAFLLNITFPSIDLLIVDEAHHYKHGIEGGVSYRNQVMSRLMGVIQEEDKTKIFVHFPFLENRIKKKVKKVIFLSATPIDNGLYELKNQLDCFLPNHKFSHSSNINEDIRTGLSSFMIRGLMNIQLEHEESNNGLVSRNMYRHEHRRGNVLKQEDAKPQFIEDDLESMIIGLMQFKTLQKFNESNNKSFEIGMLAGFETFDTKSNSDKEYEETASRNFNESQDQGIIKSIADSYFETFKDHLPHPKQDNLIKVLFEGIKNRTKSLVFVRRIASVIELERKLTHKIEDWQYQKIKKYINKSIRLKQMHKAFEERHEILEIDFVIENLAQKLFDNYRSELTIELIDIENPVSQIKDLLVRMYYTEDDSKELILYREHVKHHIGYSNIKKEFKELSFRLLKEFILKNNENSKEEEEFPDASDESQNYFFSNYFGSKRYIEGFNFRKRASVKDWYRFNLFHLTKLIPEISFKINKLENLTFNEKDKTDARRMDVINDLLIINVVKNGKRDFETMDEKFKSKTFLNHLFSDVLVEEFKDWVQLKWLKPSKGYSFFEDLDALIEITQGVFRNGSGLLPAFVSEAMDKDNFETSMIKILKESFPEVIEELRTILIDFDKIISTNFSNRARIQRALYGQHPIVGVSGSHKRDVSRMATQFRMPGYPYVLITTDVLKEGEDLHLYCKDVYHYGIAWNPSDMEQRTGRIDRINSNCYFQLKKDGKRSFENALQVFYPYLADTLEVNQVAKVFNKMNDFVQTFYDISIKREKETTVSSDEIVEEIPIQIKELLTSKYDHGNFIGITSNDEEKLKINLGIGNTKEELSRYLSDLQLLLDRNFKYLDEESKLNIEQFTLTANIDLNERRGPLRISIIQGKHYSELMYSIESIICRSSELREIKKRKEIKDCLTSHTLNLKDNNDFLLVQDSISLNSINLAIVDAIKKVVLIADELELKYTSGDLEGF